MQNTEHLDRAFRILGNARAPAMSEDFMLGVWVRAGQMEEEIAQRRRLAVMVGMAFVGLTTGFGTIQAPAYAQPQAYQLIEGADLSPAALLHVEP